MNTKPKPKGIPPLIPILAIIFCIFIGILIFAYIETKRINPEMIEVGRVDSLVYPISTVV